MTRTSRGETFCGICGHLLTPLNFPVCDECRRKLLDIDNGGLEAAKRRAREMSEWDGAGTATRP